MPLPFHPNPGLIVVCDFSSGFQAPEMIKKRPCVIISPRLRGVGGLSTVVPLSSKKPNPFEAFHHTLTFTPPLPPPFDDAVCWVKGDMLYTVSHTRLNLPHQRGTSGKREYITRFIDAQDLQAVQDCVLAGLGISLCVQKPSPTS